MDIKTLLQKCDRANHQKGKRVTILGAGLAGLVAAYELERLGHRVDIMEGSSRLGGRIWTHHFGGSEAPYGELGAMRIPHDHEYVLHYVHAMGLSEKLCKFVTLFEEPNTLLNIQGKTFRVKDIAQQALQTHYQDIFLNQSYSENTRLFAAWLKTVVDVIGSGELRQSLESDLKSHILKELEKLDLQPFFRSGGQTIDLHAFFKTYPNFQGLFGKAIGLFIGRDLLIEISPKLLQLQGGMDQLPNYLAKAINGPIRCNQEVVALRVHEDCVEVSWLERGQLHTRICDYVLCTIPFTILRQMELSGFDYEKLTTIHNTVYWPATKVLFRCQQPFWQDVGIFRGASFSDEGIRQIYYPSVMGKLSQGNVLLASYTIGNDAEHLGKKPESDRISYVHKAISKLHPEIDTPGMLLDTATVAWGNYKWSSGGCALPWNHGRSYESQSIPITARPQNTLFFAGEHCSRLTAWLQGAVESALVAVHDIVAHKPLTNLARHSSSNSKLPLS